MFVAEATVFFQSCFPSIILSRSIKTSELFQNESIEIRQNWLEILKTIIENGELKSANLSEKVLLVVNKEQTANTSTESNNDTNDDDDDVDDWCEIEEGPSLK